MWERSFTFKKLEDELDLSLLKKGDEIAGFRPGLNDFDKPVLGIHARYEGAGYFNGGDELEMVVSFPSHMTNTPPEGFDDEALVKARNTSKICVSTWYPNDFFLQGESELYLIRTEKPENKHVKAKFWKPGESPQLPSNITVFNTQFF